MILLSGCQHCQTDWQWSDPPLSMNIPVKISGVRNIVSSPQIRALDINHRQYLWWPVRLSWPWKIVFEWNIFIKQRIIWQFRRCGLNHLNICYSSFFRQITSRHWKIHKKLCLAVELNATFGIRYGHFSSVDGGGGGGSGHDSLRDKAEIFWQMMVAVRGGEIMTWLYCTSVHHQKDQSRKSIMLSTSTSVITTSAHKHWLSLPIQWADERRMQMLEMNREEDNVSIQQVKTLSPLYRRPV